MYVLLAISPILDIIASNIKPSDYQADFFQGQSTLKSMSRQLKAHELYFNDTSQHRSDGLIKLFSLRKAELLLLETKHASIIIGAYLVHWQC
ncbi:uncharacterized protein RHIMIDRAFT_270207 [Rhizopus microsporus ATCC 52813]|uniref:Uncharacterized protein n=1 Tax=Rhizopus microsporus ATCC 52813 TaxID=1340429 RepID=A0A2G4SII7_RHIZD|nr:uncharacterized protein RHIMIDRAFT_270207 [Rhizopus microsporus ATCC 52813]PHZ08206.1 hypothetical protein RHIMIDRAFT_270207 [Rhizopus microsporus ATCC 52813]